METNLDIDDLIVLLSSDPEDKNGHERSITKGMFECLDTFIEEDFEVEL